MTEKRIGKHERRKPTSCRQLKLSEAQQLDLRVWYYSERTIEEKARKLGISVRTLYRYVQRQHKPRKETIGQLMSVLTDVPH